MGPVDTADDGGYCGGPNLIHLGYFVPIYAHLKKGANLANFVSVQYCRSMALANRRSVSLFSHHVLDVVIAGSEKQMLNSATRRVVAAMANEFSCWYWAVEKLPHHPMRLEILASTAYLAIAATEFAPNPNLAFHKRNVSDAAKEPFLPWRVIHNPSCLA
jgi:hypothetical protein